MPGDARHDDRTMKYPSIISMHVLVLGNERALSCREQLPFVAAAASKHVCRASLMEARLFGFSSARAGLGSHHCFRVIHRFGGRTYPG